MKALHVFVRKILFIVLHDSPLLKKENWIDLINYNNQSMENH